MRCEDVEKELAGGTPDTSGSSDAVRLHVLGCPDCRRAQLVFARISEVLRADPVWEPPAGFAARVAAQVPSPVQEPSILPLFLSPTVVRTGLGSILVAAAAYLVQVFPLASAPDWITPGATTVIWTSAMISLCGATWCMRRALL